MLRVALTGGVATGKTYVRTRIAASGVPTIDADAVVHALFAAGTETSRDIVSRFGPAVAAPDGTIDRQALGALVFEDESERRALEAIVHPRVYERLAAWMAFQAGRDVGWVVAEIPLLFETGRERDFDRVIVAACSEEEQVRRLVRRLGIAESVARVRVAAQWPVGEKAKRASDVIDTSGSLEETDRQVDALCRRIDAAARAEGTRADRSDHRPL